MAAEPTAQQMAALLTQWNDWLAGRTDAMLSLEDRVRTAGSDKDRADLAAAFVARKVVGDRLQAITDLADQDRARAAALATEPLVDNLGSPVGQNLADAAALVDAIVQRVESHVSTVETRSATEVAAGHSRRRRPHGRRAAGRPTRQSRQQGRSAARRPHRPSRSGGALPSAPPSCAASSNKQTPSDVSCSRRGRRSTNGSSRSPNRRPRCVSWRNDAARRSRRRPRLPFHPSPQWVRSSPIDELKAMPWAAARAVMAPVVAKIERLEAALSEARRRFQQPIDARDDLRGLLQSFRDKAASRHWARMPTSSRSTARPNRCCGRRRAMSLRHARWSSNTWPPSTPRSRRA